PRRAPRKRRASSFWRSTPKASFAPGSGRTGTPSADSPNRDPERNVVMRALKIVGERQIAVLDRPDPRPEPGEVVVQMKAAAICGSDLHPYRHPGPDLLKSDLIPGHEPCGVIAEIGSEVRDWSVGERVVVYFRRTCG